MSADRKSNVIARVGLVGIIGNLFLFVIKIIIAIVSKSQAMLADSINSGTDILSSLMTLVGGKLAAEAPDKGHNYGHAKAEYVFSLIISLITGYLAIKIAWDGAVSLIDRNVFEFSWYLILVCAITMITKFFLYLYTRKVGKENDDILILTNAQDHKNDILVTASVLVGVIVAVFKIYWLDGIIAICIATRIFYVAIDFFVQSYTVLIDRSMDDVEIKEIESIIKTYKNIDHIDKITSKSTGKSFIVIVKVSVDGNMTVNESHQIAGKLKSDIMKLKNVYDVVIHINPV
jgi:cation diffusion facilitator family transporter